MKKAFMRLFCIKLNFSICGLFDLDLKLFSKVFIKIYFLDNIVQNIIL